MLKVIEKHMILILKKQKSISEVARILWVSRTTIYNWKRKYEEEWILGLLDDQPWPKDGQAWNRTKEEIEDKVIEYIRKYREHWPKTVRDILRDEEGVRLDSTTIRRIGKRRHVKYGVPPEKKRKRDWKLYSLDTPWEIQVDVSFPYGRRRHICAYHGIDDCTRMVYGAIEEGFWINESIYFVNSLIEKMPFKIKTIRTDNGKEFWKAFTEYLKSIGIKHIRNEPYMPQHNGKIERYHGTWKRLEVFHWNNDMELDEIRYRNSQWLSYYNTQRRHSWLWMYHLTPLQKLFHYLYSSYSVNLSLQQHKLNIS